MDTEKRKGIITSILDKYLGGIKEYAGILTLFITVGATTLGALIRFGIYSYYYGFVFYWNLPKEVINIDSNNTFYNIAFYSIFSLFIIVVNSLFYNLFKRLNEKWHIILSIICLSLYFITSLTARVATDVSEIILWILMITLICIFPAYTFSLGKIALKIKSKTHKKPKVDEKNYSLKEQVWQCLVIISIIAILEVAMLFGLGYLSAKSTTSFRVVEENGNSSAIIYETSDAYYISPCVLEDGTIVDIDKGYKTLIGKENINYTHHQYVKK